MFPEFSDLERGHSRRPIREDGGGQTRTSLLCMCEWSWCRRLCRRCSTSHKFGVAKKLSGSKLQSELFKPQTVLSPNFFFRRVFLTKNFSSFWPNWCSFTVCTYLDLSEQQKWNLCWRKQCRGRERDLIPVTQRGASGSMSPPPAARASSTAANLS